MLSHGMIQDVPMRKTCLFTTAFAILLWQTTALHCAPVPPKVSTIPFFPTDVGTTWVYSYPTGKLVYKISCSYRLPVTGICIIKVVETVDDGTIPVYTVVLSKKGMAFLAPSESSINTATWMIKFGDDTSRKWDFDCVSKGNRIKGTITVSEPQKLKVPAGSYDAVRVHWDYRINEDRQRRSYWYAPGVGLLKQETETSYLVLDSFTKPGPK